MSSRDYARTQIDTLPDSIIEKVIEYISFQKFNHGMYDSDTDYLTSVPGMVDKIKSGMNTPLSECVPLSEVWDIVKVTSMWTHYE
ncbi:MAG: hypothetical protein FWD34_07820 [Oscillospiraceae bacterium]|nr:hypothetical protein [Oscillospiraceae bacterium]